MKKNKLALFGFVALVLSGCTSKKPSSTVAPSSTSSSVVASTTPATSLPASTSKPSSTPNSVPSSTPSSTPTPSTSVAPAKKTPAEVTEMLKSTPYTSNIVDNYGLSDASIVGVKESEIKELYAVKADSEFEAGCIIEVASLTLADAKEFDNSIEVLNDYVKLNTAFKKAKQLNDSEKEAKIKLPKTLELDLKALSVTHAVSISGLNGCYVEGDDTVITVVTEQLQYKGYFNLSGCKNVHFNNVTMQLSAPGTLMGVVTGADTSAKTITIKVGEEFAPIIAALKATPKPLKSYEEFHYQDENPLQNGNFMVDSFNGYDITDVEGGYQMVIRFKNPITRPRNQSRASLAFSQYDVTGMTLSSCEDVYIENVTMHHASGMALTSGNTTNLYINRFNLKLKEDSSRLMTATADAMHFNSMHGDVKVTNSLIENAHDDALNLKHGYWYTLTNAEGGTTREITVARMTGTVEEPKVGDKIAVYEEGTFIGHNPAGGSYTIKSVTPTSNGYTFQVNERMTGVAEWGYCRVTFISNTPNFLFENNIVRNKRNRGVLVQVPGAVIRNNTFMNIGHGSIQAASAMDIYNEATLPQAISIVNNKFINNCYIKPEPLYGDISIFAIANNGSVAPAKTLQNALIENNFINNNGNAGIALRGVGNSIIKDNFFSECSRMQPSGDSFNCLVFLYNVDSLSLDGNYNHYTLDNGLSGIITQGRVLESDIEIKANNHEIEFMKNTEVGPEINIGKATGSITIDGSLADWENIGATNIEILGVSDAEGVAHTASEIESNFKINKLMMTYTDEGIYFGADIYDNELNVKTVNDFWLGDCIEIFISTVTNMPNADMQVYKDEGGVIQAAFAPTWASSGYCALSGVRTNSAYMDRKSQIQSSFTLGSNGYIGEIFIPFTFAPELKQSIDNNERIDIAIIVADAERSGGLKRIQMGNVPHFVEDYKTKTARMPQYLFN